MSTDQPDLFGWAAGDPFGPASKPVRRKEPVGPVYQGVGKSIRELEQLHAAEDPDAGKAWSRRMAATAAQARSLARSIDRQSGDYSGYKPASGVSLQSMHERLDALMMRLDPDGVVASGPTGWDQAMGELAELEREQLRRVMDR